MQVKVAQQTFLFEEIRCLPKLWITFNSQIKMLLPEYYKVNLSCNPNLFSVTLPGVERSTPFLRELVFWDFKWLLTFWTTKQGKARACLY